MTLKTLFVINPRAADGVILKTGSAVEDLISLTLGRIGVIYTSGPMSAVLQTRQALADGYEQIVAVGGDGQRLFTFNRYSQQSKTSG